WDIGACWVVGADGLARCGPAWHVGASRALDQFVRVSSALTYRSDEGSLGRAWASGELVCIDTWTSARDFTRDSLARQAGLATGVVLPPSGGRLPAAPEFFSRRPLALGVGTLDALRAGAVQ